MPVTPSHMPHSLLLSSSVLLTYSLVKFIHLPTQLLLSSPSFAPVSSASNLESDFQRCCATSCCVFVFLCETHLFGQKEIWLVAQLERRTWDLTHTVLETGSQSDSVGAFWISPSSHFWRVRFNYKTRACLKQWCNCDHTKQDWLFQAQNPLPNKMHFMFPLLSKDLRCCTWNTQSAACFEFVCFLW